LGELLRHPEPASASADDERWALVQRIASSRHLLKAPQLREILFYLARRALTDNPAAISEQEIGCKVLGRRADFNPNEDNIVRVQVRHLRRKLEEYFTSEGAEEPIILSIPKGAYLPHFEPRPAPPPGVAPLPEPPVPGATTGIAPPASQSARLRLAIVVLSVLTVALGLTSAILWRQKEQVRRAPGAGLAAADPFWSKFFAPGRETSIVLADTCLVAIQDVLHVDIPLSDYLGGAYPERLFASIPDRGLKAALQLLSTRQYTSLGDAMIAVRLMDVSRRYAAETHVRYSRFVSVREFKTGNFILIGSRRGMPWEQLFESQLNFHLEENRKTRKFQFSNKAPHPGERAFYGVSNDGTANQDTYADIAILPNLGGAGYVLMLSGIDMAATEAAGELVTSPDFPAELDKLLKSRTGQRPASYIEILLEAKATAGTSEGSRIVAYRLLDGPHPGA
jgi:hypothetical protein